MGTAKNILLRNSTTYVQISQFYQHFLANLVMHMLHHIFEFKRYICLEHFDNAFMVQNCKNDKNVSRIVKIIHSAVVAIHVNYMLDRKSKIIIVTSYKQHSKKFPAI